MFIFGIMKLRTLLSIMLIGMISMTAFATTSKLEQKSKPTITLDQKVYVDVVNVEAQDFVCVEVKTKPQSIANTQFYLKNVDEPFSNVAALDDVGWYSFRINFNQYFKSKLSGTNLKQIIKIINLSKPRIRSDC